MTDHTTHDLAIARAERDAWQSTCEELHRTIAGRDVEIEAHLGRCEAADQRARSLDAALTAERDAAIAERDACAYDLRAIRDLVAPGNPQGTVVDAVRAMATGLIESIGARDAAEQARDMARDSRDAAIARAEAAERDARELRATVNGIAGRLGCAEDVGAVLRRFGDLCVEVDDLRAKVGEVAVLTATRDRLLAREHEDGRLHAQLRAEVAELRARPVLTEDLLRGALDAHGHAALTRKLFAHLGPFTLPSPDRAEELTAAIYGDSFSELRAADQSSMVERTRAALAKLSPAPAPTFDAAFLRRVLVATKHGPNGKGGPGPCDAACVKCEAELMAKAAPAREVAPTLVAVSDEELAVAFYSEPERPALRECIDAADLAGIRAVRAKFGAAEVTEERVKAALKLLDGTTSSDDLTDDESLDDRVTFFMTSLRATAAKGG